MRRVVIGWLLAALGAVTMTLAVAGCLWAHRTIWADQFDLTPFWIAGGAVLSVGGALLGAGLAMLNSR